MTQRRHYTSRREATPPQLEVLAYLREFFAENDQLPPLSCIQQRFGWKSRNTAMPYLKALERLKYLERNDCGNLMFSRKKEAA